MCNASITAKVNTKIKVSVILGLGLGLWLGICPDQYLHFNQLYDLRICNLHFTDGPNYLPGHCFDHCPGQTDLYLGHAVHYLFTMCDIC